MTTLGRHGRKLATLAVLSAAALVPAVLGRYWAFVAATAIGFSLYALSIVVITGFTGQISLAQASIGGMGAFFASAAIYQVGLPYYAGILAGIAVAVAASVLIGLPSLRLRGLQFAVATWSFTLFTDRFIFTWDKLGYKGLTGVPLQRPVIAGVNFADDSRYYYLLLAVGFLVFWLVGNLRNSGLGAALNLVRDDEIAAAAMGVHVARAKLAAFAVSGALAGLAGIIMASLVFRVLAISFSPIVSVNLLAIAVIGGVRMISGAALAGAMFAAVPELLRVFRSLQGEKWLLFLGAFLIFAQWLGTGGLAGAAERLWLTVRRANATHRLRVGPAAGRPLAGVGLGRRPRPGLVPRSGRVSALLAPGELVIR
ncbi:MAG: branched-chain amino acid ABC transporter permease [Actinomycetota bacterium]|jgi:branched-chain amino acid transport system permease protein